MDKIQLNYAKSSSIELGIPYRIIEKQIVNGKVKSIQDINKVLFAIAKKGAGHFSRKLKGSILKKVKSFCSSAISKAESASNNSIEINTNGCLEEYDLIYKKLREIKMMRCYNKHNSIFLKVKKAMKDIQNMSYFRLYPGDTTTLEISFISKNKTIISLQDGSKIDLGHFMFKVNFFNPLKVNVLPAGDNTFVKGGFYHPNIVPSGDVLIGKDILSMVNVDVDNSVIDEVFGPFLDFDFLKIEKIIHLVLNNYSRESAIMPIERFLDAGKSKMKYSKKSVFAEFLFGSKRNLNNNAIDHNYVRLHSGTHIGDCLYLFSMPILDSERKLTYLEHRYHHLMDIDKDEFVFTPHIEEKLLVESGKCIEKIIKDENNPIRMKLLNLDAGAIPPITAEYLSKEANIFKYSECHSGLRISGWAVSSPHTL